MILNLINNNINNLHLMIVQLHMYYIRITNNNNNNIYFITDPLFY